jgi:hypothetical protein
MRNKILVFFIILSGMVSADTGSYVGYWSVKCGGFGGYINVSQSSTVTININDNNLLVDARLVESRGGYAELFFVDVLESRNVYRSSYHLTPASNRCLVYATLVRTSFGINFRPFLNML